MTCTVPSRARLFGVKMNGGVSAKIINEERFSAWSWIPVQTPRFASTVFGQKGLHIAVFLIIGICNMVYFLLRHGIFGIENPEEIYTARNSGVVGNSISFLQRLLTWLVSGYVSNIVSNYYRGAKQKGGLMFASMSSFVGVITPHIKYDTNGSEEFANDLWGAVSGMGHYALARASSNTKFEVSEEEMRQMFDERGLDGEYLLSLNKKETASTLYCAILQTLTEDMNNRRFLKPTFDTEVYTTIADYLGNLLEGSLRVISSMSSNKLPYAYHELLHWGVRNSMFFTTLFSYTQLAFAHGTTKKDDEYAPYPFTCASSVMGSYNVGLCTTDEFIFFNIIRIIETYFVLGCLELYPTLAKTWEHSLNLKNYNGVVESICRPLKAENNLQRMTLRELSKRKSRVSGNGLRQESSELEMWGAGSAGGE